MNTEDIYRATLYMVSKDRQRVQMKRYLMGKRIEWTCWTITLCCIAAIIGMAIWHW